MRVTGLWRYPVKSLGGEPLAVAELTANGVAGDRLVHVSSGGSSSGGSWGGSGSGSGGGGGGGQGGSGGGRGGGGEGRGGSGGGRGGGHARRPGPVTGRTRHGLLTLPVATGADGVPTVAGHRWDSGAAGELVRARAGDDARLVADDGPSRFDVLNLLVATDGAVALFGHDVRRLRPNLLLGGGIPADAEATWPGQALAVGDALIGVHSLRQRCIVTTIDPDTGERDLEVLRQIRDDFGGELALNCWVIRPGTVRLGQTVELVPTAAEPEHVGGWIVGAPYALA